MCRAPGPSQVLVRSHFDLVSAIQACFLPAEDSRGGQRSTLTPPSRFDPHLYSLVRYLWPSLRPPVIFRTHLKRSVPQGKVCSGGPSRDPLRASCMMQNRIAGPRTRSPGPSGPAPPLKVHSHHGEVKAWRDVFITRGALGSIIHRSVFEQVRK